METAAMMQLGGADRRCTSPTNWPATPGWWCCPLGSWFHSGVSSQSSPPTGRGPGRWTGTGLDVMSRRSSRLLLNLPAWWCRRNVAASDWNHTGCSGRGAAGQPGWIKNKSCYSNHVHRSRSYSHSFVGGWTDLISLYRKVYRNPDKVVRLCHL